MKSLTPIPKDLQLPSFEEYVTHRPNSWAGMSISWLKNERQIEPVFLDRFICAGPDESSSVLFLGAKYELLDGLFDGEPLGVGHFLEFFVFRKQPSGNWIVERLVQKSGAVFSSVSERNDYLPPRWNSQSTAIWPIHDGTPMVFVGQVTFPDDQATAELLTSDSTAYLFKSQKSDASTFKLVEQRLNAQTADEHYALEMEMRNSKR
jgi:hypothetical protein